MNRKNHQERRSAMLTRRHLIGSAGAGLALTGSGLGLGSAADAAGGLELPAGLPQGLRDSAVLDTLPGKKPLIKLSYRPPNYETPLQYFRTAITPNDAFFVRYHLAGIPEVDATTCTLTVGGEGAIGQAELTLDDRKAFPAVEPAAVHLCSGKRRGLFQPHVPGVQWAARAGRGRASGTSWTRSDSRRRRSRWTSTAPTRPSATSPPTSSRASPPGKRSRTRRLSPTR